MYKKCPMCDKRCMDLENYCTKCGVELVKDENRCSEEKTSMCFRREYKDDDIYCAYCGALTTYALDQKQAKEKHSE